MRRVVAPGYAGPVDEPGLSSRDRGATVVGVLAGLTVGYLGWLAAVSIGEAVTTVSQWSLIILLLSVALAGLAALTGWRLRHRHSYPLAGFAFALPVLPVVLAVSVLSYAYL